MRKPKSTPSKPAEAREMFVISIGGHHYAASPALAARLLADLSALQEVTRDGWREPCRLVPKGSGTPAFYSAELALVLPALPPAAEAGPLRLTHQPLAIGYDKGRDNG